MGNTIISTGPKADVRELEYVAALQQTCDGETRANATVSSLDIMRFLQSRYSLSLSHDQARKIVQGLGGGQLSTDLREKMAERILETQTTSGLHLQPHHERWRKAEHIQDDYEALSKEILHPKIEYLDLVQIQSFLLIPTIARYAELWKERSPDLQPFASVEVGLSETDNGQVSEKVPKFEVKDDSSSGPSLDPEPKHLLEFVLRCMWRALKGNASTDGSDVETEGEAEAPLLTPEMVRALLRHNGELERAEDDDTVMAMVDAATTGSGRFDEAAFVQALTTDLSAWQVGSEKAFGSFEKDILQFDSRGHLSADDSEQEGSHMNPISESDVPVGDGMNTTGTPLVSADEEKTELKPGKEGTGTQVMLQKNTLQFLDQVVDSERSSIAHVIAWLAYLSSSSVYTAIILSTDTFSYECPEQDLGCTFGWTILSWLAIALLMSAFGIIVFLPLSFGNHPTERSPLRLLAAVFFAACFVIAPSHVIESIESRDITLDKEYKIVRFIGMAAGYALLLYYTFQLVVSVAENYLITGGPKSFLSKMTQSSSEVGSSRLKYATIHKTNRVLRNALEMHDTPFSTAREDSKYSAPKVMSQHDPVFQNYMIQGERHEEIPIFLWTWKQLLSGRLFNTQGIWLPARLWVFQAVQLVTIAFLILLLPRITDIMIDNVGRAKRELPEGLPTWMYTLVPDAKDVEAAVVPASVISVLVCISIHVWYIPSTVSTVLAYRSGLYKALGSSVFDEARAAPDAAHMNTANAIYGMVAGSSLFFVLFALLIFLFVWEVTAEGMMLVLAWLVGLLITVLLKVLLTACFRKKFYKAFYRIRPGSANLIALAFECWYLGLGGGILINRLTQFFFAAAFWVGRIDQPFLAENVRVVGYKFDYVPSNYVKEILVHEAHRHPYVERLGAMYLMRCRHENFGSRGGSCWRQLLVLTLMPWLIKHRVDHHQRCMASLKDQLQETIETSEESGLVKDKTRIAGAEPTRTA